MQTFIGDIRYYEGEVWIWYARTHNDIARYIKVETLGL